MKLKEFILILKRIRAKFPFIGCITWGFSVTLSVLTWIELELTRRHWTLGDSKPQKSTLKWTDDWLIGSGNVTTIFFNKVHFSDLGCLDNNNSNSSNSNNEKNEELDGRDVTIVCGSIISIAWREIAEKSTIISFEYFDLRFGFSRLLKI